MGGKIHLTKEEKFKNSLKLWDEDLDNRPFIRIKEDKQKDAFEYERKRRKINIEKERISAITGDPLQNINLFDSMGHEYSKGGNIRDYKN